MSNLREMRSMNLLLASRLLSVFINPKTYHNLVSFQIANYLNGFLYQIIRVDRIFTPYRV
jgi:hypothetical protein